MSKLSRFLPHLFVTSLLVSAFAWATDVSQGPGSAPSLAPWRVVSSFYVAAGAPAATVAVSTSSTAATGLTPRAVYRVACNVPVFYRTGTGTPVALTTDAPIYGPAVDYVGLVGATTAIAFVTATGTGSCVVSLITP